MYYTPFDGEKTSWHDGFDRYDFVMDEETLAIAPFKAPAGEGFGVKDPAKGQRRCIVIVPRQAVPGNPWSWRGCYWDHQPQTEVEFLKRGFHIAYISANATLKPGKEWDAWYAFLTEKHGLSQEAGLHRHEPRRRVCLHLGDGSSGSGRLHLRRQSRLQSRDALMKLGDLARRDVPLLHVCGSIDPHPGQVFDRRSRASISSSAAESP